MKKIDLQDKLIIENGEAKIKNNELVFIIKKNFLYVFIPVVLCIAILLFFIVDTMTIYAKLLFILPWILMILYYKFYYLKITIRDYNEYVLIINDKRISYYANNDYIDLPLNLVNSIEDKSFYYEYTEDNGRFRHGWQNRLEITISNANLYLENLDKKHKLFFKINKYDNTAIMNIYGLNINHDNHIKLVEFIQNLITG